MKVVLAEKRDQAMKLAAPFQTKSGNGYIEVLQCPTFPKGAYISWCLGHLFSLKEPQDYDSKWKSWSLDTLPIIPEQFHYSIVTGRNKQFQVIKKLVKDPKVSEIIIGCDAGISL
jgi:DNA topoisomerase-3